MKVAKLVEPKKIEVNLPFDDEVKNGTSDFN